MIQFPKQEVEQFFRTYRIRQFTVSKDETLLVFSSDMSGKPNLWAMDLPQTFPYPITYHDQDAGFIRIDPEKRHILASFDNDGDENYQIYALPIDGGKPFPVVTGEKSEKYYFGDLSKDGERLYYMTSKGNPQFLNIRRFNINTKEDTLLLEGKDGSTHFAAISPDESSFAFVRAFANTYVIGYVQIGEEAVSLVPKPEVDHTVSDGVYMDPQNLYFVTNYEDDFSYVAHFNLESRIFAPVIKIENEDVKSITWHKNSQTLYIVTEKGVEDHLYQYDVNSGNLSKMDAPVDVIEQLTIAESGNMYLLGRGAAKTFNIFRKNVGEAWQRLTDNRVLGVAEQDMSDPEVITYSSFDGLPIESLLFRAKPENANGYTIFWPHGGPQAAERKFFRALFQFLIGRGYNIFAPNFRGSTGYGAEFTKMIEGDWGEAPRLDCVAGIEWLFENKVVDRDKLFIMGGSFGGYMTLLLAGRHPEYFRAAIDIFGVSNLFSFINSVPEHWKPMMKRWVGDPIEDKERLTKDSPTTYLDTMVKPMLVIQGANDPRVVKEESDQIVAALKEKGTHVEYLVLEDEGHGFSKKENEIKVNRLILDFLERHQ